MKKLIMMALTFVGVTLMSYGGSDYKDLTIDEIKNNFNYVKALAATNIYEASKVHMSLVYKPLRYRVYECKDCIELAEEADEAFYQLGLIGSWYDYTKPTLPFKKINKACYDKYGAETNWPYIVSLARKYESIAWCTVFTADKVQTVELIGLLNEGINSKRDVCYEYKFISRIRNELQKSVLRYAKRYVRRHGSEIVATNGANKCEIVMTEFNKALNAPYFNGLNDWLQKFEIDASIDTSKLPNSEAIQKLKDDILDGEKDITSDDEFTLKICLGVDGYNEFVKSYNGEQ